MIKSVTLCVPRYVRKFIMSEPDYDCVSPGVFNVPKRSELGQLIQGFSMTIPYTEIMPRMVKSKSTEFITFEYSCKKQTFDIPVHRYPDLVNFLIEQFRASLIREVSILHAVHPGESYGWMVRFFLAKRGVVTDDSEDAKDMEWDAVKKIYRDHLSRTQRKNMDNRDILTSSLSELQQIRML